MAQGRGSSELLREGSGQPHTTGHGGPYLRGWGVVRGADKRRQEGTPHGEAGQGPERARGATRVTGRSGWVLCDASWEVGSLSLVVRAEPGVKVMPHTYGVQVW